MYVKCRLNGDLWPVQELRISEGYNEGWTFSAVIPGLTDRVFSSVGLEVGNGEDALSLALRLEGSTEDIYGMELRGRDKASCDLSHALYDGSTLHCLSAGSAVGALCSASGVSVSGSPQSMNIHYASTDVQSSLELINALLDTAASRYNSDGSRFTLTSVSLSASAHHVLEDVISAEFSVDYEAKEGNIRLNKTTPCDINQTVTVSQVSAHGSAEGMLMTSRELSCTPPDLTEWLRMCQAATFDAVNDPDHLVLADGTKLRLTNSSSAGTENAASPEGSQSNEYPSGNGYPGEGGEELETATAVINTGPTKITEFALCRASGDQQFTFKYSWQNAKLYEFKLNDNPTEYVVDVSGLSTYTDENGNVFAYRDMGSVSHYYTVSGICKMYCCSPIPAERYPFVTGSMTQDSRFSHNDYHVIYSRYAYDRAESFGPSLNRSSFPANTLVWNGQSSILSEQNEFLRSGGTYVLEITPPRTYEHGTYNSERAVEYVYNQDTLLIRGQRDYRSRASAGPEIPPASAYPFYHVKKDVDIDFSQDCIFDYDMDTGTTSGTGTVNDIGKFVITFGASEFNSDFNPRASIPSWTDDQGNVIQQTDHLYAGPCYEYRYSFDNGNGTSTEAVDYSRGSSLALNAAARVVSYAITRTRSNQSHCAMRENVSELSLSDYMPVGSYDRTEVRAVGVSQNACPTGYAPSFSYGYPDNNAKNGYVKTSTHWQTQTDAERNAAFYLWWENRDCRTAAFTLPLRLDIRAGELVAYRGVKYLVLSVTHALSVSEATTELECSQV